MKRQAAGAVGAWVLLQTVKNIPHLADAFHDNPHLLADLTHYSGADVLGSVAVAAGLVGVIFGGAWLLERLFAKRSGRTEN